MLMRILMLMARSSAWSPASLFANGEQGVWYDPSDFSTMFQDAAGTTPVTAVEQPVGLILDKSGRGNHATQATTTRRPILSARYNMLTQTDTLANAPWSGVGTINSTTVMSPIGTPTATNITIPADSYGRYQLITMPIKTGQKYTVSSWVKAAADTTINIGFNGRTQVYLNKSIQFNVTTTWTKISYTITATVDDIALYIFPACTHVLGTPGVAIDSPRTIDIWGSTFVAADHIDLPYQRIVTTTDYDTVGFKQYAKFDAVDDVLNTTFGSSLGASCTVARAVPGVGASILTSQTIGTNYPTTDNSAALVIVNRALSAPETTGLTAYLNAKAGV